MNCLIRCNESFDREVLDLGRNLWAREIPPDVLSEAQRSLADGMATFRVVALPSTGATLLEENAGFLERDGTDVVISDFYRIPSEALALSV